MSIYRSFGCVTLMATINRRRPMFKLSVRNIVLALLGLITLALLWVYLTVWRSLPILDGQLSLAGLQQSTQIERDAQGLVTITAQNRSDTAFALGFLHAQERFFQMDLLRRNSAGELSELFGSLAVKFDSKMRIHQFRKRAQLAVEQLPVAHKAVLDAYTKGVNTGLAKLGSKPFEYHILRTAPAPWQHADSALVLLSMYIDLQPEWSESERSLAVMNDLLPQDWFEFLTSQGGHWDAPLEGGPFTENQTLPQLPFAQLLSQLSANKGQLDNHEQTVQAYQFFDQVHVGSNNWSVSGALTEHGSAMVADDMHLKIRVPNIWYRASWYLEDGRRLTGASLPGTPAIVVGSNEHIAWGFTNSQGDYHDVIVLQSNPEQSQYLTQNGYEDFILEKETIQVKGEAPQTVTVKLTQWGPVIGENQKGQLLAMRWVTHDVEGVNFRLLDLETANTVTDGLTIAAQSGVPGQNLNIVDSQGNQAWTIMGRIPKRFGFATGMGQRDVNGQYSGSQMPQDWSKGDKGWAGYLAADEYPTVINPANGRIWTANARIVGGEKLQKVGVNNYALGPRQQQIRDDMLAIETFTEQDFLNIQLDDRAVFLTRWQQFLLQLLVKQNNPDYAPAINVLNNWQGRASTSSAGYLLVKRFRETVVDQTAGEIYRHLKDSSNEFWPVAIDNFVEYPVWQLIQQQPSEHVPQGHDNWDGFLLAMFTKTQQTLLANGGTLSEQTWGKANTLNVAHPLSKAIPVLSWLLDMPAEPMAGDTYMPRVQKPDMGASQRFAVAPGHEAQGYFHMATGQSGHPLSPYYDVGHRDWVEGKPSGFLPGETKWQLSLQPE